jgi:hypothetical protein
MVRIEVDRHHAVCRSFLDRGKLAGGMNPGSVEIPAVPVWIIYDIVAYRSGFDLCSPLGGSIGESHRARQPIPVEWSVRELWKDRRELDLQPMLIRMHTDSLVAPFLVRLAIGAEKEPPSFPPTPPLGLGEGRCL